MTEEEKKIIQDFASGVAHLRPMAVAIFTKHLGEMKNKTKASTEMLFMSEVCNKCPDLILRAKYRKELIELKNGKLGR